jgi:hypothetical protein
MSALIEHQEHRGVFCARPHGSDLALAAAIRRLECLLATTEPELAEAMIAAALEVFARQVRRPVPVAAAEPAQPMYAGAWRPRPVAAIDGQ